MSQRCVFILGYAVVMLICCNSETTDIIQHDIVKMIMLEIM